jgi:hypothetical protein
MDFVSVSSGPEIGTSCIDWAELNMFYLKTKIESCLQNVVFWKTNRTVFLGKDRMMDNVQKNNIYSNSSDSSEIQNYPQ